MPAQEATAVKVHDTLLLFGATGDLSQRYLFPSLVHLLRGQLPGGATPSRLVMQVKNS